MADMEQVISFAQESSLSIPPSFISTTRKLSFEKNDGQVYASIVAQVIFFGLLTL